MHPRNRHAGRYDFDLLVKLSPELEGVAYLNPSGEPTIDFTDPGSVLILNRALLRTCYGIAFWDLPPGYLCPPIPGRADYIHFAADLIGGRRGESVRVLDVGVGANCVYPIIGRAEYGWRFVGSDIDRAALAAAQRIVDANPVLAGGVELRLQTSPASMFSGVVNAGESFGLTLCNPPFHASLDEAREASREKWAKLGRSRDTGRNFGGAENELWHPGGEEAFARRLIEESAAFAGQVRWFTVLISKASSLRAVEAALTKAEALERRIIPMEQGQKKSRVVAWTFRPA
ncbi:MAG: 23S rRNA (adenine(1618)-N(6))-methyltransferase RlmF [Elusimicrobiota bacterium]|nr:23S rRNA (adenine(1618)-N(6))-methyltransferase RlmF [Elusimicrobiota bacterium]